MYCRTEPEPYDRFTSSTVRCPGHTIQYMRFGYVEYVGQVLELAGLTRKQTMEEYETWTPYRL